MAQKRNMSSSSSLKPDYFIAHNGLPNILTTRHMIRQAATTTTTSSRNRLQQQKNSCTRDSKSQKNKQNLIEMQRACLKKSEKDLINYESKSSSHNRHGKLLDRLNGTILSSPSLPKNSESDNECNQNIKRRSKEMVTNSNNKFTHQRKYDNKIFRHDLPDRIILPPLPV